MDDGETAPPAAQKPKKEESTPHIPHELVTVILSRLPVESLMRFSGVCKAWRSTISLDASFHREHLRLQKPFLLVSPQTVADGQVHTPDTVILYRWDDSQQGAALPVVHATDLSSEEVMHRPAHCDGLILLATEATVLVVNPATRRTVTLPWSPSAEPPRGFFYHQSFGFGHDPRSDAYKVLRFFYRSYKKVSSTVYTTGMEVFTIGTDRQWRETAKDPPYPVLRQTATFFKGSLLWKIDEPMLGHAAPGFLRFNLEDEAFGVMPPPPLDQTRRVDYQWCAMAELRGELCLAVDGAPEADIRTIELWMCDNVENPHWDQRYTISCVTSLRPPHFNPVGIFDDDIVFKEWYFSTRRYNLKSKTYTNRLRLTDLQYHNPITGMLGYQGSHFDNFDVIPYIPSLIRI
jgi:F-box interacting protein